MVGVSAPPPRTEGVRLDWPAGASPHRTIALPSYEVHVGAGVLGSVGRVIAERASAHTVAVVADDQVFPVLGREVVAAVSAGLPGARVIARSIPSGERFKTRATWAALTDWLLEERCGRDSCLVALGGGVVGDLVGFVAATFMRGVPFVQLPTSLLAMVDASVGGKVGVDTPGGKNLVGAFHQPSAVLIDPLVLRTLPAAHRRAGMAEVLKHGIIADPSYLERALALGPAVVAGEGDRLWESAPLIDLVARSVEIKADVVRVDEREAGRRQVLNFGHTVGHAIEAASGYALLHGEAIAIGMVLEARLAEWLGVADAGTAQAVQDAMAAVGLPTTLPPGMEPHDLLARMAGDKKARRGQVVMALPARVGEMAGGSSGFGVVVREDDILPVLSGSGIA